MWNINPHWFFTQWEKNPARNQCCKNRQVKTSAKFVNFLPIVTTTVECGSVWTHPANKISDTRVREGGEFAVNVSDSGAGGVYHGTPALPRLENKEQTTSIARLGRRQYDWQTATRMGGKMRTSNSYRTVIIGLAVMVQGLNLPFKVPACLLYASVKPLQFGVLMISSDWDVDGNL